MSDDRQSCATLQQRGCACIMMVHIRLGLRLDGVLNSATSRNDSRVL